MKIQIRQDKIFEGKNSQSILASALQAGLVLEYSCKTGQCGVCMTNLLEGEVVELKEQLALSDDDRKAGKILTCCCAPKTDILIDAEDLSALHGIETKTLPARIQSIKKYTPNIIEVTLRLPPTASHKFLEGQYLDVIQNGIRRSYSIASTSCEKEIKLFIKQYPNGQMSSYWFNQAKENDLLRIEGPKGTFFLRDDSKPLLFLATGTGIAPIMSILNSLEENENFHQHETITVYWGNRYPEEFVWEPKFKKIDIEFVRACSKPNQDWQGETGYVQDVAIKKQPDLVESSVYACGSNAMIQTAKQVFIEAGLSENQFYSDAFVQSY